NGRSETQLAAVCGRARIEVTGAGRPFDSTPLYDLTARTDRLPDRIPGLPWWEPLARRVPARVSMRLQGSGYARPGLNLAGRVSGEAGSIDLDAGLDMTKRVAWNVRRLELRDVDLARVVGDSTASRVSGVLTAAGEDTTRRSRRMTASLVLSPSSYGA